jgi:DNA recombination protein RmuC
MFLPAEAIFAEINAYHPDLVEYAQKKRVWVCSPTTLMAVLTTLQVVLQNAEREKHAHIIQEELMKLGLEFKRYTTRWDNLAKHIDTVSKDVKDIHITTTKIGNRFDSIKNVELEENLIEKIEE